MSGFSAFMTGFAGRTADRIAERKGKAEDYFQEQLQRARTIGMENLANRTASQQEMLSVANNLVSQAGMPENLVRQLANEGPGALQQAMEIYNTAAANGTQVDQTFWQNVYDFSTEVVQGSDMSLEDFLRQVNGLYPSNLAATTREGGDPFGAFIASGLGLNAMERAQEQLGEWDMGGGYTAADLLAMEARPSNTRPLGNTGFGGPNLNAFYEATAQEDRVELSPDQALRITDQFYSGVEEEMQRLADQARDLDPATAGSVESYREQAQRNVAERIFGTIGVEYIPLLPEIAIFLDMSEEEATPPLGDEIITTTLPPATQEDVIPSSDLEEAGIPVTTPDLPQPSVSGQEPVVYESGQSDLKLEDGTIAIYVGTTPTGKLRYKLQDGSFVEGTREEIDAQIESGAASRVPSMGLGGMDDSQPLYPD